MLREEYRLLLRNRDLQTLGRKHDVTRTDMDMIVGFARDIRQDADAILAKGRVLHPDVERVLGLVKTIVFLADKTNRT
jgi:hypothetical protein